MNERIKELAEQATSIVEMVGSYANFDKKKFAELIVRECLAHGKLTQSQTVANGSEEYNAGREMGIEVFMNRIKQNFGVEE
jgi:hypothetical protein